MEHAFGSRPAFELGMEEELFLVAPGTLELAHVSTRLLPRVHSDAGVVMHDTYEAMVESASPVCPDASGGGRRLQALRDALRDAGATLMGAGLHPGGAFGDVVHVPADRYRAIADSMRGLLRRTPTAAIHAHVGMPDPETAIRCVNGLRAFLPVLQALASHSPYWHGRESGFASARAQLFRAYPRAVIPRELASWEDYVELVGEWTRAGEMADYTFLWWDLRPHPKLGTVEVRAMDAQSRLASTVGLACLVHGLALACADSTDVPSMSSEAIAESSFRAGRDGLDARVLWRDEQRPVREVAAEALEIARAHVPDGAPLEEVERILRDGNGADRMRAAHAGGGLASVLELLVAETAEPFSGA
jgi:carboxylate-amine ligase